jgi:hypothetical protein
MICNGIRLEAINTLIIYIKKQCRPYASMKYLHRNIAIGSSSTKHAVIPFIGKWLIDVCSNKETIHEKNIKLSSPLINTACRLTRLLNTANLDRQ